MGLFVEFDVIDDFGYLDVTEEYNIIPDYSEGSRAFVETFLRVARDLVPVDTGYLRSTLTAEGDDSYCCAETDCEYAQYPEYGTWCQAPQPYFEPALEAAINAAVPYWDRAQQDAEEEEALLIEEEEEERMAMSSGGRGGGRASPSRFGGINFSSFAGFLGSVLGIIIVGFISAVFKDLLGLSSRSSSRGHSSRRSWLGGVIARAFIPDVIIT